MCGKFLKEGWTLDLKLVRNPQGNRIFYLRKKRGKRKKLFGFRRWGERRIKWIPWKRICWNWSRRIRLLSLYGSMFHNSIFTDLFSFFSLSFFFCFLSFIYFPFLFLEPDALDRDGENLWSTEVATWNFFFLFSFWKDKNYDLVENANGSVPRDHLQNDLLSLSLFIHAPRHF